MGHMIAFLPSEPDADDLAVTGGLPPRELHATIRYYGKNVTDDQEHQLVGIAERIAEQTAPFVADIIESGQLGDDTPAADVLHINHPALTAAYNQTPPPWDDDVTRYPTYQPHVTVGYGTTDKLDSIDHTIGIRFDRIAVATPDGTWTVIPLTGPDPDDEDDNNTEYREGDHVTFELDDQPATGVIEHVMTDGHYGTPGSRYYGPATPDNPALVIRIWENGQETELLTGRFADDITATTHTAAFTPFKKKKKAPAPKFTAQQRRDMAENGVAMEDGSFPIRDGEHAADDLHRAIQALGRAKDRDAAENHIATRAKALNLTLPPWIGKPHTAALNPTTGHIPGHGYLNDTDVHYDARLAAARGRAKALIKDATGANKRSRKPSTNPSPFKGKHQRCLHGTPATCKSVKWLRVYTALRERRGFSKEKSARIANSMHAHWLSGIPRKGDKRPIVRKAFP